LPQREKVVGFHYKISLSRNINYQTRISNRINGSGLLLSLATMPPHFISFQKR
jgi:hypothetical protein